MLNKATNASDDTIAEFVRLMNVAKKPVLYVGQGVLQVGAFAGSAAGRHCGAAPRRDALHPPLC